MINQVQITGTLNNLDAMRYTPGGVPVIGGRLSHESEQTEGGLKRKVSCEIPLKFVGEISRELSAESLGKAVNITGFFAARSQTSRALVLHVQTLNFI